MTTSYSKMAAVLALAGALSLSGCSNPLDKVVQKGVNTAVETATGGAVSVDTSGSGKGVALPTGWPDIPTPSTKPVAAMKIDDTLSATFTVDESEVNRIIDALTASGYEIIYQMEASDQKMLTFQGSEWTISLVSGADDDGGTMLLYTVLPADQDD